MKKTAVLLMLTATLAAMAEVKITETNKTVKETQCHHFAVKNGSPAKYEIDYNVRTKDGKTTVGDPTANSTGIGLNYGWYGSGTIRIFINGKSITTPAEKIKVLNDTITWQWPQAVLTLQFPEGNERIQGTVTATDKDAKLRVEFNVMPGYRSKRTEPYEPYVSTAKGNHSIVSGPFTDLDGCWQMLYDGKLNTRGYCVVIFDPEQTASVKAGAGSAKNPVFNTAFSAKGQTFRFALWGISVKSMDAESVYADMLENGEKYRQELSKK